VVERDTCNTLLTLSGYCTNNACPASFICTSQAAGIFPAITRELAVGTLLSRVPVMIKVGLDAFVSSPQINRQSTLGLELDSFPISWPINCLPKRGDYFFTEKLYLFNVIVNRPEVNTIHSCFKKSLYLSNTIIYRSKEE
jgi:hypothetical protein